MNEFIIEPIKMYSDALATDIQSLAKQIGKNSKPLSKEDVREMIEAPSITIFGAKDTQTGHIVGMISLVVYRIPYVKKAHLEDLVVDEAYRKKGIGTRLFQTVIQAAKAAHVAHVDFTSRPRREANLLYEKLGFQKRKTNVYRLVIDYAEV